jgi:hypothetical protein
MTWNVLYEQRPLLSLPQAQRPQRMEKRAGLFMRPSDIADHTNLASALEQMLSGAGQGTQFKTAAVAQAQQQRRMSKTASATSPTKVMFGFNRSRLVDAGVGAIGGLVSTNRIMNRVLDEDSPVPPPQQPSGFIDRKLKPYMDDATRTARAHPVTSYLLGGTAGALAMYRSNMDLYGRANSLLHRR